MEEQIKALQAENAVLTAKVEAFRAENEALTAVNEELQAKVEELSSKATEATTEATAEKKPEIPTGTFQVDGVKYRFIAPVFTHNRERVTAEAALADKELLKSLVKNKSGLVVKA